MKMLNVLALGVRAGSPYSAMPREELTLYRIPSSSARRSGACCMAASVNTSPPHSRTSARLTAVRSTEWVRHFQPFRINDLELVAQICPRWNPLTSWMRQIEDFQKAA